MSTVQDPRKTWLATGSLLIVWWRMPSLGPRSSLPLAFWLWLLPACLSASGAGGESAQARGAASVEHRLELARWPWQQDDETVMMLDPNARRCAILVLEPVGAFRHLCLSHVVLRQIGRASCRE